MRHDPPLGEFIDEEPMTNREIDEALRPLLSRVDRRRFVWCLSRANLVVFRGLENER